MTNIVSTWFYVQGSQEGGQFAQIREDSASEKFRDIYRRCIGVFFASARRANPDAHLILFLNRPWADSCTRATIEVGLLLDQLEVERKVISYDHEPPRSFTDSWRNQFFVLDVLHQLQSNLSATDNAVILDSDVIWTSRNKAEEFWASVRHEGLTTYEVGYAPSTSVNGLSINDLRELICELGSSSTARLTYCGGEIVGGTGELIKVLSSESSRIWSYLMSRHRLDPSVAFEEAHVLSMAYASMGHEPGSADDHIRRLWTQPLKPRNVRAQDLDLSLWHVPAEKKYGFARLYQDLLRHGADHFLAESDEAFKKRVSSRLGIPRNSVSKIVLDVADASQTRIQGHAKKWFTAFSNAPQKVSPRRAQ